MKRCPCCSGRLVRHLRHQQHHSQVCWFCRHCWQDMPDYNWVDYSSKRSHPPKQLAAHGSHH